jgi:hypothetical protein
VIELVRWLCSGAFAGWGLGLVLLPGSFALIRDPRAIGALPLGAILIAVGVLLFLQFGRAKRALMRAR